MKNPTKKPTFKKTTKQFSKETEFSEIVAKTLYRYRGKRYTIGLVKKLTEELQRAVVEYCCNTPSNDERIAELHRQLKDKAILVQPHGANRLQGILFIEGVGHPKDRNDVVCISGLFYVPEDDKRGLAAYVQPLTYHFDLQTTTVRDGSLRVYNGNVYYQYSLLTKRAYKMFLDSAKSAIHILDSRLKDL